jgi:hypothetical protein
MGSLVEAKMAGGKGGKGGNLPPRIRPLDSSTISSACRGGVCAGSLKTGPAETRRELAGNRRKPPEVMDTDAFRAGGMGVAAMQYG